MPERNVEIVERVYEGVTARLEVPQELFDPEMELDQTDVPLDAIEVSLGLEAAQESLREYWEMFEDFRIEVEEVIHADEGQVVTVVRDGGRITGSDAEITNRFFHVWSFDGGKIIRLSIHTERHQALEAAGLSE
jgi:ketosteroid isomerase-like protein